MGGISRCAAAHAAALATITSSVDAADVLSALRASKSTPSPIYSPPGLLVPPALGG